VKSETEREKELKERGKKGYCKSALSLSLLAACADTHSHSTDFFSFSQYF